MLWLTKHARLRNSLSPYLDGRLTSAEIKSLEAHLASCEGCRRELDELRATVSAVRELPQAEAPRSFAITPAMLERKTPALPPRSAPLFGTGMRIAGAAVAVALTVVVVGDLTFGDNGGASREAGSQPAAESRTTAEFDAGLNAEKSSDDAAAQGGATPASAADAGATASCPSTTQPDSSTLGGGAGGAGGPASGGGAGGGAGEAPPATATVEPVPQPTPPSPAPGAEAICGDTLSDSGAAVPAAPQTPPASSAEPSTPENDVTTRAASASSDDGSISMIRVAEIALAATLVLLLAGIVIETTKRRRPSP